VIIYKYGRAKGGPDTHTGERASPLKISSKSGGPVFFLSSVCVVLCV
jgi:hypothetical protein